MTDPCGCEENNSKHTSISSVSAAQPDHMTKCPTIVHETVCVQAEVTVLPKVEVGEVKVFCVEGLDLKECRRKHELSKSCTFDVGQKICVQIPLKFSATAEAEPIGVVCDPPAKGKCPKKTGCKHKNNFLVLDCAIFRWVKEKLWHYKP